MREAFYFARYQLWHTFTSARFYVSMVLLAAGLYCIFGKVGAYLATNQVTIQVTELFTAYTNSVYAQRLLLLGSLLLLADAPFIREGLSYRLVRSNKLHWYLGQLLYCVMIAAVYLLATFLLLVCMTGGRVYFQNTWSESFLELCQSSELGEYTTQDLGILIDLNLTTGISNGGSPYQMFGLAFLYAWFLVVLNCIVGMALNLKFRIGTGMLFTLFLIILRLASVWGDSIASVIDYSSIDPCYLAEVGQRSVSAGTVGYTCTYFIILIGVAAVVAYRTAKGADMQRMVHE